MTITAALLAFLPVAVSLVLVPGVNNLVVLRETVAHGRRGGCAAIAGTSVGILAWTAAVAAGLGTLAAKHPHAFSWFQVVGATLLVSNGVWAGVKVLRHREPGLGAPPPPSRVPRATTPKAAQGTRNRRRALSGAEGASFRSAAVTSLVNPRSPVTAASVLPQFVAPGSAAALTTLALGALWTLVAGAWNLVGVQLAHRGRGVLSHPRAGRAVEAVSAAALVAVGVSVAAAAA